MHTLHRFTLALAFASLLAAPVAAHENQSAAAAPSAAMDVPADATDAVAAVDAFGKALAAGDMAAVEAALAPGVIVLESGGAERSRSEYMGHHAKADAAFLGKAHAALMRRTARVHGDVAWVASESELHTTQGARPSTTLSAETMVLERTGEGWQIVHIHWSSRPKK
jgi:ketosteroid isomerase-like protein